MNDKIFYRFEKLDLTQFATFGTDYVDDMQPLELSSSFRFSCNLDNDVVCCITTVTITRENRPVLKAELNSYFNILAESVASMIEDGCLVLPTDLMTQFASLGYGTLRGIIYARTMGTPLEKIILPPNNLRNIFTTPVKFRK